MKHAPEAVLLQLGQRESPNWVADEHRKFGRGECNGHVHQEHDARQSREQPCEQQHSADDFAGSDKRTEEMWGWDANSLKPTRAQQDGKEKLLNAFREKNSSCPRLL